MKPFFKSSGSLLLRLRNRNKIIIRINIEKIIIAVHVVLDVKDLRAFEIFHEI